MNHYEQYISEFLIENKEVSLEKIGTVKTPGGSVNAEGQSMPVDFKFDRKAITSPELIDFISAKTGKSKMLIKADLDSHLTQAREFINIGKTYEIINAGFIKKNNSGEYELLPLSQAVKAQKNFSQPLTKNTQKRKRNTSAVQLFTLLIVLAIVGGLAWEAYQFFLKPPLQNTTEAETNNADTAKTNDTTLNNDSSAAIISKPTADTTHTVTVNNDDSVLVHYIFETTPLLDRAKTRTAQLKSFGNPAGYDSIQNSGGKVYSLFLYKRTKIIDTLAVKDSIAKFLQKDIQVKIVSNQ